MPTAIGLLAARRSVARAHLHLADTEIGEVHGGRGSGHAAALHWLTCPDERATELHGRVPRAGGGGAPSRRVLRVAAAALAVPVGRRGARRRRGDRAPARSQLVAKPFHGSATRMARAGRRAPARVLRGLCP